MRALGRPSVVYLVVTIIAFPITEMLAFGHDALQYAHDAFDTIVPVNAWFADRLASGTAGLWNPTLTAGNAMLAQDPVPPATPDVWLGLLLDPFPAYLAGYAILIWLAGYGMHRFLRDALGLSTAAAYAGGATYGLGFWHVVYGFSAPLLPVLLWLADRVARGRDPAGSVPWSRLGLVTVAALTLWWGHIQVAPLVALVHLAYLAAIHGRAGFVRDVLLPWLATWGLAALLYAPVLATQLVSLGEGHRAVWDLAYLYDGTVLERVAEALDRYRTAAIGIPVAGVSAGTATHYGTWFTGGIGLSLLASGLFVTRDRRQRLFLLLLAAVPLADVLASVVSPHLGGFGLLSTFQLVRVRHLVPFVLAVNLAIGAAALLAGQRRHRSVVTALCLAAAGLGGWQLLPALGQLGQAPADHRAVGWGMAVVALAIGAIGAAGIAGLSWRRVPVPAAAVLVVVLALAGERALYARAERLVTGGLGTWAEQIDAGPPQRWLQARLLPTDRTLTAGQHPNARVLSGFHDAAGYVATYPLAYHGLFGVLVDPYLRTDPVQHQYFHGWGNRAYVFGPALDAELLDLLGVRWLYAATWTFETDASLRPAHVAGGVTVYENVDALPRAFVAGGVVTHESTADLLDALGTATTAELHATAHLLAADWDGPVGAADAPAGKATITSYAGDEVRIRADAAEPGVLVLSDVDAVGWTVVVDGAPAELLRADAALRAVRIPAGTSEVVFAYRPLFTYAGAVVAATTVAGLAGWAVWYRRRRDRPGGVDGDTALDRQA